MPDTTFDDLLPVRMLNEVVYCPRPAHLERVQCEWASNLDVIEGHAVHRRVTATEDAPLPAPAGVAAVDTDDPFRVARSVRLADPGLGITGVLDLVEAVVI